MNPCQPFLRTLVRSRVASLHHHVPAIYLQCLAPGHPRRRYSQKDDAQKSPEYIGQDAENSTSNKSNSGLVSYILGRSEDESSLGLENPVTVALPIRAVVARDMLPPRRRVRTCKRKRDDFGDLLLVRRGRAPPSLRQLSRASVRPGMWMQSRAWIYGWRDLHRYYDIRFPDVYLKERKAPPLYFKARAWAAEVARAIEEKKDVHAIFKPARGVGIRVYRWEQAALWLMYHNPASAVDFLAATISLPSLNRRHFRELLRYLVAHFYHSKDPDAAKHVNRLCSLMPLLVEGNTDFAVAWANSTIYRFMRVCDLNILTDLFMVLRDRNVIIKWYTWLHLSAYFTRQDEFELGLEALFRAQSAGAKLNHPAFASACSIILRRCIRVPDGLRVCLRLVDHLTRCGLELSTQLCDVLILNSAEAGDMKTALSIKQTMIQYGMKTTVYTWAALLKGCKRYLDDAEMLNTIIRGAIEASAVLENDVVAMEILHSLWLHHREHNPGRTFHILSDAYAELFDVTPLQELGLLTDRSQSEKRMTPTPHAYRILIDAYLTHLEIHGIGQHAAQKLYQRHRELVLAGAQPHLTAASSDHTSNRFMLYFIRSEKGLLSAAQIVKDMQKPQPKGLSMDIATPTALTWSIFLEGFTRHHKMKLAEQIMNYMRGKGIEPIRSSWNKLIHGYAQLQQLEPMLDTLRRMESSGNLWDDYTHGAIARFQDQHTLQEKYSDGPKYQTPDFTAELRDGLSRRISTGPTSAASSSKASLYDAERPMIKEEVDDAFAKLGL